MFIHIRFYLQSGVLRCVCVCMLAVNVNICTYDEASSLVLDCKKFFYMSILFCFCTNVVDGCMDDVIIVVSWGACVSNNKYIIYNNKM